jgi:hypothetical protein
MDDKKIKYLDEVPNLLNEKDKDIESTAQSY